MEVSTVSECGTFYPSVLTKERIKKVVEKAKSLGLKIVSYDCELLPAKWLEYSQSSCKGKRKKQLIILIQLFW